MYEMISTQGPSHDPEFFVSLKISGQEKTRASGKSKKVAEQNAAEILINELLKNAPKKENNTGKKMENNKNGK